MQLNLIGGPNVLEILSHKLLSQTNLFCYIEKCAGTHSRHCSGPRLEEETQLLSIVHQEL